MDWGVLGGILEGLRGHWGGLGDVWRRSWEVLGRSERARRDKTEKRSKKEGGDHPQGEGLWAPLDAKIDPRKQEIEEKTNEAIKLKISIWTRKTRVQMDLGGVME